MKTWPARAFCDSSSGCNAFTWKAPSQIGLASRRRAQSLAASMGGRTRISLAPEMTFCWAAPSVAPLIGLISRSCARGMATTKSASFGSLSAPEILNTQWAAVATSRGPRQKAVQTVLACVL